MAEDLYWVQIAYHRPRVVAPKVAPCGSEWPLPSAEAEAISSELTGQTPPDDLTQVRAVGPEPEEKIRVLTKEQEDAELAEMRATDNPRIRQIFNILDAPSKGQPLPDGVRLNQGDLVAPGLILEENPFPDWFHAEMVKYGWEYNRGNASFMLGVEGKQKAEAWYFWVMEILKRMKEHETSTGAPALSASIGVYIREDHSLLWNDELTKIYT